MTKSFKLSLLAGLLFVMQSSAWAADNVEKISVNADHMQLNTETGYSEYSGNVKITQGALTLTGDRVTIQQTEGVVERITIIGKPARYNHVTQQGENVQAQSEHMVYIANQNKLVMTVNAKLKQLGHQVSSQTIVYDTEKKIVVAGDKNDSSSAESGSSTNQRVNITLTPKKQSQATKTSSPEKSSPKQ